MVGVDVVTAVFVPHDHRDRVGLDDQVPGQLACLVGRGIRGRLIRVSDGDQVGHDFSLSHLWLFSPGAGRHQGRC
jgi:hypothetical protein